MRIVWGVFAAISGLYSLPTFAQVAPDPVAREAQRIEEREQERQRAREEEVRAKQATPPSGVEIPPNSTPTETSGQCVAIKTVTLNGMTRYSRAEFSGVLNKLVGDCVSIGAVDAALRDITNRYVSDGYVTSRAVVGPQDLKDGVLDIIVVEGQVSGVESPKGGYGKSALGAAFAGVKGGHLNLRAVEQGVDQLARLQSGEPDIDIAPADLPGSSTVVVKRKSVDKFIRPSVSFDNDGSASTGRWQSTMTVDVDNPIGVADFWSLYYSRDLQGKDNVGSQGFGGFVSVPFGFWTVSFSGGRYAYKSILAGNGQTFANTGRSINGSVTIDRMLFRDSKTKFSVSGVLALVDTENRIQGIRLSTSSYRQVTGALGLRMQRKMLGGLVGADLGFSHGLNILGANAANTGPGGASIFAGRLNASLTYQTKTVGFGIPLDYSAILRGQAALDPVFSSGRFSVGGSSTVRGFRDDGISGRYGLFTRHQIGFPLFKLFKGDEALETGLRGFVGYDAGGIVSHNSDQFERGFMHSSTLGLRVQHRHIQAELMASAPLSAPSFIQRKRVELSASFRVIF